MKNILLPISHEVKNAQKQYYMCENVKRLQSFVIPLIVTFETARRFDVNAKLLLIGLGSCHLLLLMQFVSQPHNHACSLSLRTSHVYVAHGGYTCMHRQCGHMPVCTVAYVNQLSHSHLRCNMLYWALHNFSTDFHFVFPTFCLQFTNLLHRDVLITQHL